MKLSGAWVASAFFIGLNLLAAAGNDSSGGVESYRLGDVHAWFVGRDKEVRACVKVGERYPESPKTLQGLIKESFEMWSAYAAYKNIMAYSATKFSFAHQIVFNEKCDGKENLTFYFGTKDKKVEEAAVRYSNPYAMAELETYDPVATWGKGFVWLDDFSVRRVSSLAGQNGVMKAVLNHEIGHVFGCEHSPGTVMSPHLIEDMYAMRNGEGIDMFHDNSRMSYGRELVPCQGKCTGTYRPIPSPFGGFNPYRSYELLTGKKASVHVDLEFVRHDGEDEGVQGDLIFRIAGKEERFSFVPLKRLSRELEHAPLFVVQYKALGETILHVSSSFQETSASYLGSIRLASGKNLSALLSINQEVPLEIQSLDLEHVKSGSSLMQAYRAK